MQLVDMWFVYIIKSKQNLKHYIGCTSNLNRRIEEHNRGYNKSTKFHIPWELLYVEKFETQEDAFNRERKIKSYKGGNAFKKLINE